MVKVGKVSLIALSLSVFSSSLLSAVTPFEGIKEFWKEKSAGEKVMILGFPAAIIAAVGWIYHMVTKEESNAKVYERINRLHSHSFDAYKNLLQGEFIHSRTEADLIKYISQASVFETKLANVAKDLRQLKEARDLLQSRLARDAQKNSPLLSQMNALCREVRSLIEALEPLNEFWYQHKYFFRAYTASVSESVLRYKDAVERSTDHAFIKRTIMAQAVQGYAKIDYPYIYFVNTLKSTINDLMQHRQKVARYPLLYGRMVMLVDSLQNLLEIIVVMPDYTNELYLKKQHELEQERIAVERQKAEAERAKAHAIAQQAAAEREKVAAMYQQAAAEREKAQALKEQTVAQLMQQKPQNIHINVQSPANSVPTVAPQPQAAQSAKPQSAPQSIPVEPSAATMPPSYEATMFYEAIVTLTPEAINRLDFHIPQLEQRYGRAEKVIIDGHSLISAAIDARQLDTFHKGELIAWLQQYGIKPTAPDKQKARHTGEATIIKAVCD